MFVVVVTKPVDFYCCSRRSPEERIWFVTKEIQTDFTISNELDLEISKPATEVTVSKQVTEEAWCKA